MADGQTGEVETKRGRVRRLLIEPMRALGFRRPGKWRAAAWEQELVKIADDLAYLSNQNLDVLFGMLRSKGQGAARNEWPARATILGLAQVVQPRPVEEMPNLVSWFRSAAGPRAEAAGELVEEFRFFEARHRPPLNDGERRVISERAFENRRRLQIIAERSAPTVEDRAWRAAYMQDEARVKAIMAGGVS